MKNLTNFCIISQLFSFLHRRSSEEPNYTLHSINRQILFSGFFTCFLQFSVFQQLLFLLITTFIFQLLGNWNSVNSTQAWVGRRNAMLFLNYRNGNLMCSLLFYT
ncbi:hypothetical protein QG098_10025, partial [Kingella kingae]|nr:hypothetical protein [Kingella kingae]MDK4687632.1 hypothetical protein [Kingella kingae]